MVVPRDSGSFDDLTEFGAFICQLSTYPVQMALELMIDSTSGLVRLRLGFARIIRHWHVNLNMRFALNCLLSGQFSS